MGERRILITGSSGFIGTNLLSHYLAGGEIVLGVDRLPASSPHLRQVSAQIDLLDGDAIRRTAAAFLPTHVLHMGGRTDLQGRSVADYAANTDGTRHLLSALHAAGSTERAIYASTRMVAPISYRPRDDDDVCPPNPYGRSKAEMERLVRQYAPGEFTIVRPTSIWGPWFGVPYRGFFRAVAAGHYFHPRGMKIWKSFGFVGNTVLQIDQLLSAPTATVAGKTFYLADNPPLEVSAWARLIASTAGARPPREVPPTTLKMLAKLGDASKALGFSEPPLTTFRLQNLVTNMIYDVTSTIAIVGPPRYSLREGVKVTVQWLRSQDYLR